VNSIVYFYCEQLKLDQVQVNIGGPDLGYFDKAGTWTKNELHRFGGTISWN